MAIELGASSTDVRLSGKSAVSDLHDEHDRVFEHDTAEDHQEPVVVPKRRSGLQADVSGIEKYQQAMDNADQELERRAQSVRDPV